MNLDAWTRRRCKVEYSLGTQQVSRPQNSRFYRYQQLPYIRVMSLRRPELEPCKDTRSMRINQLHDKSFLGTVRLSSQKTHHTSSDSNWLGAPEDQFVLRGKGIVGLTRLERRKSW